MTLHSSETHSANYNRKTSILNYYTLTSHYLLTILIDYLNPIDSISRCQIDFIDLIRNVRYIMTLL